MLDNPETYLSWDDSGITLMCERKECMTDDGKYWWYEYLPYPCIPEQAVLLRAQHVATHSQE